MVLVILTYQFLIMFLQEEEEKEEKEISKKKQSDATQEDLALKEMTTPTAKEAQEQARARAVDKQEQLCELSRAIAVLASASVSIKHHLHEIAPGADQYVITNQCFF